MFDFDAFARLYDADYGDWTADLELFLPFADHVGGPILEAMCGTGRVLTHLATVGHRVVGFDVSPAMVGIAQTKIAAGGWQTARAIADDIRTFSLNERFALAIVAMNSFMHLDSTEDQIAALRRLHAHLKPGGLLVLDLFNPDPHELIADEGVLVHVKSFTFDDQSVQKYVLRRTDLALQTHYVEFVYDEIGPDRLVRRSVLPFTMRWLYRYELEHLLSLTGYTLEAVYGAYDLEPYASSSERLIAVARRPGSAASYPAGRRRRTRI